MEILENFIVFEGLDGSGTTTQLTMLEEFFQQNRNRLSLPLLYKTFEPTNGSIGNVIRACLRKEYSLLPETVAMLFAADRNEHVYGNDGIAGRCRRGELVVCDRYVLSSLVYQGLLCGDELPARLNREFPQPELLIFFDIDPEAAQERMAGRGLKEIYEYLEFQVQVRGRYKSLLPRLAGQGVRVEVVDASPPPQDVAGAVWRILREMPIINHKP
ncbi:MAG: dTMP kinase [Treponema sp.]|nr:dTMP kinase [Treponema sp.]